MKILQSCEAKYEKTVHLQGSNSKEDHKAEILNMLKLYELKMSYVHKSSMFC